MANAPFAHALVGWPLVDDQLDRMYRAGWRQSAEHPEQQPHLCTGVGKVVEEDSPQGIVGHYRFDVRP
jgi:hypothetical protein